MFQGFYRLYLIYTNVEIEIDAFFMLISSLLSLLINVIMMFSLTHDHDHGHGHDHDHGHSSLNSSIMELKKNSRFNSFNSKSNEENKIELLLVNSEEEIDKPHEKIKSKDHNLQAAFIHILGDMLQSLGVVIAALTLYYHPTMIIIDPLISIVFSIIAFSFTVPITLNILRFLVDKTPDHLNIDLIEKNLLKIKNVKEIHFLHVWSVSSHNSYLTCHLIVSENKENYVLNKAIAIVSNFGINKYTFQIEIANKELYVKCNQETPLKN